MKKSRETCINYYFPYMFKVAPFNKCIVNNFVLFNSVFNSVYRHFIFDKVDERDVNLYIMILLEDQLFSISVCVSAVLFNKQIHHLIFNINQYGQILQLVERKKGCLPIKNFIFSPNSTTPYAVASGISSSNFDLF